MIFFVYIHFNDKKKLFKNTSCILIYLMYHKIKKHVVLINSALFFFLCQLGFFFIFSRCRNGSF
jgi:hypothetical protein